MCLNRLVDVLDHGFVRFGTEFEILTDSDGNPVKADFHMIEESDLPNENGLFLNLKWKKVETIFEQRVFMACRIKKIPKNKSNLMVLLLPANIEKLQQALLSFYTGGESSGSGYNLIEYEFEEFKEFKPVAGLFDFNYKTNSSKSFDGVFMF